jgi:sporulation protein YlmC with PRC-barrel domain
MFNETEHRMIASNNAAALIGSDVIDQDGDKIGTVGHLFVDPSTGQPNWITVKSGFFGMSHVFVPLDDADVEGDSIRVPYAKDFVKDAPHVDTDGPLSPEDEQQLHDYYRGVREPERPTVSGESTTGPVGDPTEPERRTETVASPMDVPPRAETDVPPRAVYQQPNVPPPATTDVAPSAAPSAAYDQPQATTDVPPQTTHGRHARTDSEPR